MDHYNIIQRNSSPIANLLGEPSVKRIGDIQLNSYLEKEDIKGELEKRGLRLPKCCRVEGRLGEHLYFSGTNIELVKRGIY